MNKDLISIILPVYNAEKTVSSTIESILSQTYENFELIIINDGSSDSSDDICKKFQNADNRIVYISRTNEGVSKTRNEGISLSKGKYLMFIDADDSLKKTMLEIMIKSINMSSLAICGYERINEKNSFCVKKYITDEKFNASNYDRMIEKLQNNNLFNQVWNKIFLKRNIVNNNVKFDESLSLGEDFRFVLDYLNYCDNVNVISDVLYRYANSTNGLNAKVRSNILDIRLSNSKYLIDFFEKMKYNNDYSYHNYIKAYASSLRALSRFKEKKIKKQLLKEFTIRANSDELLKKILKNSNNKADRIVTILFLNKSKVLLKALMFALSMIDFYNKKRLGY